MSRLKCKCGKLLSNSENPEIDYEVFSFDEWIQFADQVYECSDIIGNNKNRIHFWKCDDCLRIYIFENDNDTPLQIYNIEESNEDMASW